MTESDFILVVDDDDDIRESICSLLQDEGHTVIAAANGQEALDALRKHGLPCLILLDLMMPVMGGAEFRQRQLADWQLAKVPVVLITAAGHAVAKAIPADGLLPKPLKAEAVIGAVESFCAHAA